MGRLLGIGWMAALLALTFGAGCPTEEPDDDDASPAGEADLDADTDQSGALDGSDAEDAAEVDEPGAVVKVNVDDDNADAVLDCDGACAEENDLAEGALTLTGLGEDDTVLLTLDGDVDLIRIWLEDEPVLGMVDGVEVTDVELEGVEVADLWFEAMDFNFQATLILEVFSAEDDSLVADDELLLSTPPFMMFNHLDPSRTLYVMNQNISNGQMRNGIKEAIGDENVVEFPVGQYGWDVWIQDEMEFGYQQTPYGPMDLVLDSIRNGTLDPLPEDHLLGPDFGHLVRGTPPATGWASSLDSFGNLECTPPITVDGVEYPFGRIYYGGKPGVVQMTQPLREFLDAQEIQSPVEIDSTWLLVGHVDEFMVWVPDPSSAKGFKLLVVDWEVTRSVLEALDPRMAIPRFADSYGYGTVGELLNPTIVAYNEDVDALYLQPVLASVMEAFGLEEEDLIRIPGLWEQAWGSAVALVPGMANLAVYDEHLLIADPFLRTIDEDIDGNGELTTWAEDINASGAFDTEEDANGNGILDEGEDINGNGVLDTEEDRNGNWQLDEGEDFNGDGLLNTFRDPFKLYLVDVIPDGLVPHFLDDWNDYHLMEGEVHCGTNILRTPRADLAWWEVQ